jgi:ubiquitin-activating enzyme E1
MTMRIFESLFDHGIRDLLYTFPEDHKTSTGAPFWSGPKRAPTPIKLDLDDKIHLMFVHATVNLIAVSVGKKPKKLF